MRDKENNSTGFLFLIGLIVGIIYINSGIDIDVILKNISKIVNVMFVILLIIGFTCLVYGLSLVHDGKKYGDGESRDIGIVFSIFSFILLIICFCVLIYF